MLGVQFINSWGGGSLTCDIAGHATQEAADIRQTNNPAQPQSICCHGCNCLNQSKAQLKPHSCSRLLQVT